MNAFESENSLGADLRALRKRRGRTLSDLADALGRSVGWLSQVERNISEPSIGELRELSAALDVPISLFFSQGAAVAHEDGRIVRADARRRIGGGEMGLVEELLSPDLTDDFEMLRSVFKPGAKLEEMQQRDTTEVGYVVSGRLNLQIGDQDYDLREGDSFRIRGESFRWENKGDADAVVIWVISPPIY
ncbi:MAG: XRE family transcriptional regulator [Pseudomonadota bacterium]